MKTAVSVDTNVLLKAIKLAEQNGPLPNRSVLYDCVHSHYQTLAPNPKVTVSVIMLRITKTMDQYNKPFFTVITPVGKRGRVKGQIIGSVNRTKRADKVDKNALTILYQTTPEKYHSLVDKIAAGSASAAIKLKCLECVNFERFTKVDDKPSTKSDDNIGGCKIFGCPLWQIRPYQKA